MLGEPAYETGAWLRNPFSELLGWEDVEDVLRRRIVQMAAALGFDPQRIVAWGVYQAVLSAWWSYEEQAPDFEMWLVVADRIAATGA